MLYKSLRRSEKNGVTHENSGNTIQNTQIANKWLTKDVKKRICSNEQVIDGFL